LLRPTILILQVLSEEYAFQVSYLNLATTEIQPTLKITSTTSCMMPALKRMKFLKNLMGWATVPSKKRKQEDVENKENVSLV
jgi:hypothetical protein